MKKCAIMLILCLVMMLSCVLSASAALQTGDPNTPGEGDVIDWNDFWGDSEPNGTDTNNEDATDAPNAGADSTTAGETEKKGCSNSIFALPILICVSVSTVVLANKKIKKD